MAPDGLWKICAKGVAVGEIYACGNLAKNSKEVMQIFADVLGKPIHVTRLAVSCAYGAAMYGQWQLVGLRRDGTLLQK